MNMLNTRPNMDDADGFYAMLLEQYEGLSKEQCDGFNARLVLLLANHIGDMEVLKAAMAAARSGEGSGEYPGEK